MQHDLPDNPPETITFTIDGDLEAVALDFDGVIKPINELSYATRSTSELVHRWNVPLDADCSQSGLILQYRNLRFLAFAQSLTVSPVSESPAHAIRECCLVQHVLLLGVFL